MEPLKCSHKGCSNTHKSETGFCCEHAHEMDRQFVKPREKTFVEDIVNDEEFYDIIPGGTNQGAV